MLDFVLRISNRIYSELFPERDLIFNAEFPGDEDTSKTVSLFMDAQLRQQMEDFKRQQRRAIFEFVAHGDSVFDSYYDPKTGAPCDEQLGCEDFVYPYVWKTTKIDMSDVPCKTKILRKYKRELKALEKGGVYVGIDEFCKSDTNVDLDYVIKEVVNKFEGKDAPERDAPYTILEQHTWLKFPNEEEERPVVISIGYGSNTPLGIYIREYDDPIDRTRFETQRLEHEQYLGAVSKFTEASQRESEMHQTLLSDAVPNDEELMIREAIVARPLMPPVAPEWMEFEGEAPLPPKPVKRIPIERFTRNSCIENPSGSMGLGIGVLLQPFNEGANTMMNQFADSATAANSAGIITDESFPAGITSIAPGSVTRIRNFSAESIANKIYQLKFPQANGQLVETAKMLIDFAGGIASAPEVMSGEKVGAETYRGQAGRIEQATKQMSVIASNYIEILDHLVKNRARLNSQFLPESSEMTIFDPRTRKHVKISVERSMFFDRFDVVFTADVRFASRAQKIAEADDTLALLTRGLPPELVKLVVKPQIFAAATRQCLKARGEDDLLGYINTDEEVQQMISAPQMPIPGGMPPGEGAASGPGAMPPPSAPDGQSGASPGENSGASHPPAESPVESGAPQ
jgi:hypothetical protein